MAVEQNRLPRQAQNWNAVRDLVAKDDVVVSEEHDDEGNVNHPEDSECDMEPKEDMARQPVAINSNRVGEHS